MKKKNQQTLGEAIKMMFSEYGIEEKIISVEIESHFAEMMKGPISKYIQNVTVSKRILFVKMNSPELKSELQYGKSKIISYINQKLGKAYLEDVKFL